MLVYDNASDDGSADAVAAWNASGDGLGARLRLLRGERREGKAALDSALLEAASGDLCLLLNEDSELRPGAVAALLEALRADPRAGAAGAMLLDPEGVGPALRLATPRGRRLARLGALPAPRTGHRERRRAGTREVGWVQSAAMLVRREAASAVGYLDPAFFVYSDETDFCKRLHDAGWRILHVPGAEVVHHEQLATDLAARDRRIVEFHRGRDLYLRKHHGAAVALACRPLNAWPYAVRALAALVLPGHDPRLYLAHARQAFRPGHGEGLREAATAYNAARSRRS